MASLGLLVESAQLHVQNGALPFAEPVVRSIDEMTVEPFPGHPATVVHGSRLNLEFIVIRNDDSTFPGGHQLARLKTERARDAERTDALPAPLAGVRMRRVFNQCQSFAGGD